MFEKKEYIMDSTFGVCMVEKVTKLVVGREQQMEYYVLQSAADKKKKAYIPVQNHETVLRKLMTPEQATAILGKIKVEINTNNKEEMEVLTVEEIPILGQKSVVTCYREKENYRLLLLKF